MEESLSKALNNVQKAATEIAALFENASPLEFILLEQALEKTADLKYFLERIKMAKEDESP